MLKEKNGRLLIGRKRDQRVRVKLDDQELWIRVVETRGSHGVCLEFEGPTSIEILREELINGR